ncbi:MAG: HAD family hydrolase [Deltaproteobacteria bacterium]|nr:HAD family hydrolase [Deltaproteobacteria bacterium]MBT8374467.1 HAD family hydrolase [Deltaproteobacteria bacterium]NNK85740.1 HAD family hydrolase [Desulfobacterales bacterium]NNL42605.1 HAD family hydrolase [Desulfobacterales bacterium]
MNTIKVVAFDCDGVLFDTKKANMAYYNRVLNEFGMPVMTKEQFDFTHMHTVDQSLAYLFADKATLEAAQTFRKNISYIPFLKFMEIEPHLKPLLKKLRPGFKTAIATNRTDTMDRVLIEHGLTELFDLVVTASDVKRPKPDPEPLVKIIEYFGLDPQHMIYVGDSKLDESAAKSAGVVMIAYKNRFLSADFHIESLREIEDILSIGNKEYGRIK